MGFFHELPQTGRGACVHLLPHDLGRGFQDGHRDGGLHELPGGLQTQHTAADDHGMFTGLHPGNHVFRVGQMPNGNDAVQLMALERGHEALRAHGEDELIVVVCCTVRCLHGLAVRMDGGRGHAGEKVDAPLGIPFGRMDIYGLRRGDDLVDQALGDHGAVDGQMVFCGQNGDLAGGVPLADGICRGYARGAPADNEVAPIRVVPVGDLLIVHGDALVEPYAAHRAGAQGGVENLAADEAFDELRLPGIGHAQHAAGDAEAVIESVLEVSFRGDAGHEPVWHIQPHAQGGEIAAQHIRHRLAGVLRIEHRRPLAGNVLPAQGGDDIPYRLRYIAVRPLRAEEIGVRPRQRRQHVVPAQDGEIQIQHLRRAVLIACYTAFHRLR